MNTVWLAFITGLTTGGISCFAVQGGLLASTLTQQKGSQKTAIASFLASKVFAYTLFGILLGLVGGSIAISPKLQGFMQIAAGIFMIATVGKLLEIHPIFRRFTITPPKFLFRLVRSQTNSKDIFAPAILGFLTILIPCGVTQAMILLAIATGSPLFGGLTLGAFILGTTPVFFGLGLASNQILQRKSLKFVAASAILILALISINTGQVLRGSIHTFQNYWVALTGEIEPSEISAQVAGLNSKGVQEVEIVVSGNGYHSSAQVLKAGVPVALSLITQNTKGCSRAFTIPEYNITKILPETGTQSVEFTPTRRGRLSYTCSMGMYTGYFEVI